MKIFQYFVISFLVVVLAAPLVSCSSQNQKIKMYDINTQKIVELDFEDYVAGVTAAEIDESFSKSAIEAQSIIARTYATWFLKNKTSKYSGADISNDISEAQAYTNTIPDKIGEYSSNTKGKILKIDGEVFLPYFCSNAAGKTSLPQDVFGEEAKGYAIVESLENENNSKNYSWSAEIEKSEILFAMKKLNKNLASLNSFVVGSVDSSGRAKTFVVGGVEVNANAFRLAVGSTILKSCAIDKISIKENTVEFSGRGYGHGVGLSQWGANILASQNYSFEDILKYYFKDCQIENNN
ncbi:MAG: SpoIID/LytB domain-containing protein [Clostridia bacterium]|nr:SpoIID/LytB domain-containing protein [Clostridia bacterium]